MAKTDDRSAGRTEQAALDFWRLSLYQRPSLGVYEAGLTRLARKTRATPAGQARQAISRDLVGITTGALTRRQQRKLKPFLAPLDFMTAAFMGRMQEAAISAGGNAPSSDDVNAMRRQLENPRDIWLKLMRNDIEDLAIAARWYLQFPTGELLMPRRMTLSPQNVAMPSLVTLLSDSRVLESSLDASPQANIYTFYEKMVSQTLLERMTPGASMHELLAAHRFFEAERKRTKTFVAGTMVRGGALPAIAAWLDADEFVANGVSGVLGGHVPASRALRSSERNVKSGYVMVGGGSAMSVASVAASPIISWVFTAAGVLSGVAIGASGHHLVGNIYPWAMDTKCFLRYQEERDVSFQRTRVRDEIDSALIKSLNDIDALCQAIEVRVGEQCATDERWAQNVSVKDLSAEQLVTFNRALARVNERGGARRAASMETYGRWAIATEGLRTGVTPDDRVPTGDRTAFTEAQAFTQPVHRMPPDDFDWSFMG